MIHTSSPKSPFVQYLVKHGPPHYQPIALAIRHGAGLAQVMQHEGSFRVPLDKPTMLIIGDDLHLALGPKAFNTGSLRRFVQRAGHAIVVSSWPDPRAYAAAAYSAAVLREHAVLVETLPEFEQAWIDAITGINPKINMTIFAVKPEGGLH
jgi:hypothetical protein